MRCCVVTFLQEKTIRSSSQSWLCFKWNNADNISSTNQQEDFLWNIIVSTIKLHTELQHNLRFWLSAWSDARDAFLETWNLSFQIIRDIKISQMHHQESYIFQNFQKTSIFGL